MKKGSVIFPVLLALAAADIIAAVLMVGATIAFLLVLLPLAYFLFRNRIQKPLLALVQYAQRFPEGNDDAVPASGSRMVRKLSEALQTMTDAIRQRERKLEELAAFTESDPNLMMKVARDGRIVYANRSVERKLHDLGLPPQHYELLLPDDAEKIVEGVLSGGKKNRGVMWELRGRTIDYTTFPLAREETVVFYGVDVTEETADPGVQKAICGAGNEARSRPP
jgi:PAS domain-containing protein